MEFIEKIEFKGNYINGEVLLDNKDYAMKIKTILGQKPIVENLGLLSINEFIKELQEIKDRIEKLEQTIQK